MDTHKKKKTAFEHNSRDAWFMIAGAFLIAFSLVSYANKKFSAEIVETNVAMREVYIPKDTRVWLEFEYNGKKRLFEGAAEDPPHTIEKELASLAKIAKTTFETKRGSLIEFDGHKNKTLAMWKLYKNGEVVNNFISEVYLARGDRYSFVYK